MSKKSKKKGLWPKKPSASEFILMALKKIANAPFDVLLEYGKIRNQYKLSSARMAVHRLKKKNLVYAVRRGSKLIFELTEEGEREVEKIQSRLQKLSLKVGTANGESLFLIFRRN